MKRKSVKDLEQFDLVKKKIVNNFICADMEELLEYQTSIFEKGNSVQPFMWVCLQRDSIDALELLLSETRHEFSFSDEIVEKLEDLVAIDSILMLLENMLVPVLKNERTWCKRFDKTLFVQNVRKDAMYSLFCDYFSCDEEQQMLIWAQLEKIDVLRPIFPICLFFAYLQMDKQNNAENFMNKTNLSMQEKESGYFDAGIRFINFLFEHKKDLNYFLNFHILNQYIPVPDVIFFSWFLEENLKKLKNNINYEIQPPISFPFTNISPQQNHILRLTVLRPLLCKWNLFTLMPYGKANVFTMENGFACLNHILACLSDNLFVRVKDMENSEFNQIFLKLNEMTSALTPQMPMSKVIPKTFSLAHADMYDAVRKYYI